MLTRQRKRPGGAVGSRPARKRSRLLPSSAGGTSQTEPRDLEESGAPAFEPEVIDLTGDNIRDLPGESSEAEVITISDNESPVEREQSQQQPHLSRASENSVEPLARNDEEEPIEDDGYVKVSIKTVISDKWLKEVFAKLLGSA
ncbi:E3 ubiquitin-protein ligase RNF4-like [Ammospiza nelsoni]|uniref:E3 ubiquitin-protein ligase RNF4-like n=1 Tax=Ammospiza nelsoni TaxID=2857394 RepID=UPI00286BA4E5|nr:E3 ubiquitin-protein ligase RNF4-like [Ammospiza nelsoni]